MPLSKRFQANPGPGGARLLDSVKGARRVDGGVCLRPCQVGMPAATSTGADFQHPARRVAGEARTRNPVGFASAISEGMYNARAVTKEERKYCH
jgi:hypothetical protein